MDKIKSVVFDLDGTLLDTLEDLKDSCNNALTSLGYAERTLEEVRTFVGNGLAVLMEKALPNGRSNPDFDKALAALKSFYAKNWQNKTRPYDGILSLLKELSNNGIKMGIVSNKPDEQVKELAALHFQGLILPKNAIGERESEGIRRKPYPDSVFAVLKELDTDVKNAVYVGDSEVDIATAKAANMTCLSVTWGFRPKDFLEKAGACILMDSPESVLKYVLNDLS